MTPKRGQPPKSPEEKKDERLGMRVTKDERKILEEAFNLSNSADTFSRWMAQITIEEARKIIESSRK